MNPPRDKSIQANTASLIPPPRPRGWLVRPAEISSAPTGSSAATEKTARARPDSTCCRTCPEFFACYSLCSLPLPDKLVLSGVVISEKKSADTRPETRCHHPTSRAHRQTAPGESPAHSETCRWACGGVCTAYLSSTTANARAHSRLVLNDQSRQQIHTYTRGTRPDNLPSMVSRILRAEYLDSKNLCRTYRTARLYRCSNHTAGNPRVDDGSNTQNTSAHSRLAASSC